MALCGRYLVQEYPTKHFLPKPNHWYKQHLLGLWWHSYLFPYTTISQVSVTISNIKNPPIVPFVFSGQSPDQRCQGNFWNSEDPSKTVTWAFWFLELSFCKFHAQKKKKKNMKQNVHFFMHVQGLCVDCFSAPPLSLSALWQEPQIWKGLCSDPSPISKQLNFLFLCVLWQISPIIRTLGHILGGNPSIFIHSHITIQRESFTWGEILVLRPHALKWRLREPTHTGTSSTT
jgi:hypothetical protein